MTYPTDSLESFVTAVHNYLKTRPPLVPSRQPMPAGSPWRYFVVPVFVSVLVHAFLVFQLWLSITDRTSVEREASAIDTPLILSLSSIPTDSHDGMDFEVVPAAPHTAPIAERKSEAETVVTPKVQGAWGSEAQEDKSPETAPSPSFELEAANRMAWDFGIIPEFETETVATSKVQGSPGAEAPEGKYPATGEIPSIDLEAVYRIAREGSWMSEFEVESQRIEWRIHYIKKHKSLLPPDCRTAYAGLGLLAIPLLIKDTITDSGCRWYDEMGY